MNRQKSMTPHAAILAACISAIGAVPASAIIDTTFDTGDLILGVQSSAATATVLEINVGAPLLFKNATSSFLIGNIGSQLTSLYGGTWYDSPSLFLGVSGANNNSSLSPGTANGNGDFNSTIYASRSRFGNGTFGLANSTPWSISAPEVTVAASSMLQQAGRFSTESANGIGLLATGAANDWSDFNPVGGQTQNPAYGSVFTSGIQYRFDISPFDSGNFAGLTNVEGVVDLFRVARFSNGGATPGEGQFLGSFAIERDGDVHFVPTPEPGSAALLAIGLVSALGLRPRRAGRR